MPQLEVFCVAVFWASSCSDHHPCLQVSVFLSGFNNWEYLECAPFWSLVFGFLFIVRGAAPTIGTFAFSNEIDPDGWSFTRRKMMPWTSGLRSKQMCASTVLIPLWVLGFGIWEEPPGSFCCGGRSNLQLLYNSCELYCFDATLKKAPKIQVLLWKVFFVNNCPTVTVVGWKQKQIPKRRQLWYCRWFRNPAK